MRQAGVIAAAVLWRWSRWWTGWPRITRNAAALVAGLAKLPGIEVDHVPVVTDIVYFRVCGPGLDARDLAAKLKDLGVLVSPSGGNRVRAVTNYHVTAEDIQMVLMAFRAVLQDENV